MSDTTLLYNGKPWDRTLLASVRHDGAGRDDLWFKAALESSLPDSDAVRGVRISESREGNLFETLLLLFPLDSPAAAEPVLSPLFCCAALGGRNARLCLVSPEPGLYAFIEKKSGRVAPPEWIRTADIDSDLDSWWRGYRGRKAVLFPKGGGRSAIPEIRIRCERRSADGIVTESARKKFETQMAQSGRFLLSPPYSSAAFSRRLFLFFIAALCAVNLLLPFMWKVPESNPPSSAGGAESGAAAASTEIPGSPGEKTPSPLAALETLSRMALSLSSFTWERGAWSATLLGGNAKGATDALRSVPGSELRAVRTEPNGTVRLEIAAGGMR